jgi:Restriction endonuclease XhoI/Domain of unknown function (DUF4263)
MAESVRDAARNFWSKWRRAPVAMHNADELASHSFRGGGGHWDRLSEALVHTLAEHGVDSSWIRVGRDAALPGAYGLGRSAWDLVVVKDGIPLGAVAFKSLCGPTFGNNLNNRIQELTAIAFDVRSQYDSQELYKFRPYLGLFFIIEDDERANLPLRKSADAYARIGDGLSYKERLGEIFKQFYSDGLYDGVVYVSSGRGEIPSFEEPCPEMSIDGFVVGFTERVLSLAETQGTAGITPASFGEMLSRRSDIHDVLTGITSTRTGMLAAELAVIRRRRAFLADLRELALAKESNETVMHQVLAGNYWIFGGQYVGIVARRDLMNLHQHDITLVYADRSLHIIELKGPEAPLVRRPRKNHLILSSPGHEAVGQCMNYLQMLDELGAALSTVHRKELDLNYDYRRARATVVIGHPGRIASSIATREQVDDAVRTYNGHLTRIQVLTYSDLIDTAERALEFEEDAGRSGDVMLRGGSSSAEPQGKPR